jgi:hypothetical protein
MHKRTWEKAFVYEDENDNSKYIAIKTSEIHAMGLNELELFKVKLSDSVLSADAKHILFCEVDKREASLDKNSAMAEYSEMDFD